MSTLTRTSTVMIQRLTAHTDRVLFRQELDQPAISRGITFSRADWQDMGEPTAITVTITPGDTLND